MENKLPRGLRNCNEEWRDIPGYEGRYQVSNLGRVKSLPKYHQKKETILKGDVDKWGYIHVRLCLNEKLRRKHSVHRLVAIAFIPNPSNYPEIDHINTNPSDNEVSNLRWATRRMNLANPITREKKSLASKGRTFSEETLRKMSEAKKGRKLSQHVIDVLVERNNVPVVMYDDSWNEIARFKSIKSASIITGISPKRISDVCLKKRNYAGGYRWERA